MRSIIAASLLLLGTTSSQGRLWIVDQGGGGQFTEVQPAIDAASAGDRIEVRGTYTYAAFTLRKGLDVEATQGAAAGIAITLIPFGEWTRVAGFRGGVSVRRCAGPVLLDQLQLIGSGMSIAECLSVLVRDSTIVGFTTTGNFGFPGGDGLSVFNANVALQRCSITGGGGGHASSTYRISSTPGGMGISITGGTVQIAACTVTGGPGGLGSGPAPPSPGGYGIGAGGEVLVFGACSLAGGAYGFFGAPNVALAGSPAFPGETRATADCSLSGGSSNVTFLPALPWFASPGTANLGGQTTLTLNGSPGSIAFVFFDVLHDALTVPGVEGALLLPPATAIPLFPLGIGGSGSVTLNFAVPNDPSLRNAFAFFQGAALTPGAPLPSFTNLGDLRLR